MADRTLGAEPDTTAADFMFFAISTSKGEVSVFGHKKCD
jgi:hypothetical protein